MLWFVGGLGLNKDANPLIGSFQIIQNKDIVMKQNTKKKEADRKKRKKRSLIMHCTVFDAFIRILVSC